MGLVARFGDRGHKRLWRRSADQRSRARPASARLGPGLAQRPSDRLCDPPWPPLRSQQPRRRGGHASRGRRPADAHRSRAAHGRRPRHALHYRGHPRGQRHALLRRRHADTRRPTHHAPRPQRARPPTLPRHRAPSGLQRARPDADRRPTDPQPVPARPVGHGRHRRRPARARLSHRRPRGAEPRWRRGQPCRARAGPRSLHRRPGRAHRRGAGSPRWPRHPAAPAQRRLARARPPGPRRATARPGRRR